MAATTYRETGLFDTVDLLLPVPLHPKRMRQRGYNQSEWIAYGIRSVTGIAVDTSPLSRIKKTESQTRMNACAEAMKAISGIRISILGIAVA